MAKKVSQDYFNSIVEENIDVFSMSEEEAINEAINQLKSQDIDLSTICKFSIEEQNLLLNSIKELKEISEKTFDLQRIRELLEIIKSKFDKHLSFKC
jgi:hypothetical protein